jgi:hypothetical protein
MAGVGGYQAPRNPAPVSGPGKLSRRTDGGPAQKIMAPTGMPYGDAGQMAAQEHAAPMAQSPSVPTMPVSGPSGGPDLAGMGDPSARPNEPVTAGSPMGAGPGPEVIMPQRSAGEISGILSRLAASDMTGALASLYQVAIARGV